VSSAARLDASFDAIRERLFALPRGTPVGPGALVVSLLARVPGEGVTTIAVGLARAVTRVHTLRTLLVGYDSGGRGAAAMLGVPARPFAGWADDSAASSLSAAVVPVQPGQLDLLTLGAAVPSGFAADERWAADFAQLCPAYDVILVDAGATTQPLALRWARIAALQLLVVDTGRTTAEELERLKVEWRSNGQEVDAVILNKRDFHVPGFLYRHVR
jgi:Mrp family chromosome partitioning ATPase